MTIDYKGLRLIEQVLEAEERFRHYELSSDIRQHWVLEYHRLTDLLDTWVADKFGFYDLVDVQERRQELLKTFRI